MRGVQDPGGAGAERNAVTVPRNMLPADAAPDGKVRGGTLMELADVAGAYAAVHHAHCYVVSVAVDSMCFRQPVFVGDIVEARAWVTWTGRTSIETSVVLSAMHPPEARVRQVASVYCVYVAVDDHGRPQPVRPLAVSTDEEWVQQEAALGRRARRLAASARVQRS